MPLRHTFLTLTLGALALGTASSRLPAADITWKGGVSNLWNLDGNWAGGVKPANGDSLLFGNSNTPLAVVAPASTVSLSDDFASLVLGNATTTGLTFNSGALSYLITRPGTQIITLARTDGGISLLDTSVSPQSFGPIGATAIPFVLSGAQTFQIGQTTGAVLSNLTINGAVTGGARLTKTGTGNLMFAASTNALSGVTVTGGVFSVTQDGSLSQAAPALTSNWLAINGGAFRFNNNAVTTLNANRGIVLGDSTAGSGGTFLTTITTAGNGAVGTNGIIYNGIIANNGGSNYFTKSGNGVLYLGGTNTYTGATRVMQGILQLNFAAGAAGTPTNNIINSNSALVMGGVANQFNNLTPALPTLFLQGTDGVATSQTFAGTQLDQGQSNFIARAGTTAAGTANTTLALGALSQTDGGTVTFSKLTAGGSGNAIFTTTTANVNGILGGYATIAAGSANGTVTQVQTDWAARDGSGNIVAYEGYTDLTGAGPAIASNASSNARLIGGAGNSGTATLAAAGTTDINTLLVNDTNTRIVDIGNGKILRLGANGGIWKSTAGVLTIGTGTLVADRGSLTAGGADNTAGEIVLNTLSSLITVNSAIINNGTGAVTVTKTGLGAVTLTNTNTYSGGTIVNQGQLNAAGVNTLGTGAVTVIGGAVNLSGAGTYANNFNVAGASAIIIAGSTISGSVTLVGDSSINANLGGTITGKVSGDYNLAFSAGTLTLSNTANDYGGNLGINGNVIGAGALANNNATLVLGASNVLANGAGKGDLVITGSSLTTIFSTLEMNGKTDTINGLQSSGTASQTRIINTSATAASLTVGDDGHSGYFGGTIENTGAGALSLTKIGNGVQILGGANTYLGNTTINGGQLTLSNTGQLKFAIGADGINNTVTGTGALLLDGTFLFDLTGAAASGTWNIVNVATLAEIFSSSFTVNGFTSVDAENWTLTNGNATYNFNEATGLLTATAVPEPGILALLIGGLGSVIFRRRRP